MGLGVYCTQQPKMTDKDSNQDRLVSLYRQVFELELDSRDEEQKKLQILGLIASILKSKKKVVEREKSA